MHRGDGSLLPQRWVSDCWDYHRNLELGRDCHALSDMQGNAEQSCQLVFLDEVTALAAGHRPSEIRQTSEARRFLNCWPSTDNAPAELWADIDRTLHHERLDELGRKQTHALPLHDLPDGSMFRARVGSYLHVGGRCFLWSTRGYVAATPFKADDVIEVLTPKSVLSVLRAGYEPDIHESILEFL